MGGCLVCGRRVVFYSRVYNKMDLLHNKKEIVMEQYILKSALVAEIERRKNYYENIQMIKPVYESNIEDFNELLSFIDTFEVRGVDLEKEIKKVQRKYKTIEEYEGYPCTMYADSIEWIAKHFFELGMSVSNKTQKGEEV